MTGGWCPKCGSPLDNLTNAGFGYCPEHGRQPAEFYDPKQDQKEDLPAWMVNEDD